MTGSAGNHRLARIEERLRAEVSAGHVIGVFLVTDMRALVEIAKAARPIAALDVPPTRAEWDAFIEAVARLDSGAAEGDA